MVGDRKTLVLETLSADDTGNIFRGPVFIFLNQNFNRLGAYFRCAIENRTDQCFGGKAHVALRIFVQRDLHESVELRCIFRSRIFNHDPVRI